jgi:hypothetical protein
MCSRTTPYAPSQLAKSKCILDHGSDWKLQHVLTHDHLAKNNELILRGNNKSALKCKSEYAKIVETNVIQGWMLPLPLHYIDSLHHGGLALVGIDVKVWYELPDGLKKTKYRLTHDQSFETTVGSSVNGRLILDSLSPLSYSGCFSRVINNIVSLRWPHPSFPILVGKSDFKAAYRRVSLCGDTAEKCTIMFKEFILPSLWLTFGGSPCPHEFCLLSKICTDLANDILHCEAWCPDVLCSPHAARLHEPNILDESVPFAQAKPLDTSIPVDDNGKIDIFIDDGIVVTPNIGNNKYRAIQAMLLAIHTLCHPLDPNNPIPHDDCLSVGKLEEEGQLSEKAVILGWIVDTRPFTIAIPSKKNIRWDQDLAHILVRRKVSLAVLDSTVGRLNHAAMPCPIMRYFL